MANLNFNKAIIGGRLTADVELKTSQSGKTYCGFNVAVSRRVAKDAQPQSDFIPCRAFNQTAELITKYFHKGSSIMLCGRITTGSYDKNGVKVYTQEITADEVFFVDSKSDNQAHAAPVAPVQSAGYVPEAYTNPVAPSFEELNDDDDLPF